MTGLPVCATDCRPPGQERRISVGFSYQEASRPVDGLASPVSVQRAERQAEICIVAARRARTILPPTEHGWGWKRTAVRTVVSAYHASQEHQLPLSTCHVRSGPWTAWSVTGPDRTVASRPWRLACRQPRAGIPATPPCRANQAAAATGVGWPPRSDTRDSANADPLAQADLAVAAVVGVTWAAWAAVG